jgi:ABC-2 type transport system ATP-binding protein
LVGTLSGGLQRRVELAKALLPAPAILLLDEPSTGIDPGTRRDVWKHLQMLRRTKSTTIVVNTHLMEEAAECDVVGILHKGRLVACGPPELLTANLGDDIIFVSSQNLKVLASRIKARFDTPVDIVENRLRLQQPRAHEFIPRLVEAFPGEIDAITFGKPTLEDVFMHHTGQALH